jgi:hypothetical protein
MVIQALIFLLIVIKKGDAGLSCPAGNSTCTLTLTNFTLNKVKALPNPFKGFVPYSTSRPSTINAFPTSMENQYFPMNALMTGPSTFDFYII